MNVFFEFHKVIQEIQKAGVDYALIGGVAMAFYGPMRFTKDIDLLIEDCDLKAVTECLKKEGYFPSTDPWTFSDTKITLHRFIKLEGEDQMIIDVMVSGTDKTTDIIENAIETESEGTGTVKVASKADLIWLKKQRNSSQDQVDIEILQNEETG